MRHTNMMLTDVMHFALENLVKEPEHKVSGNAENVITARFLHRKNKNKEQR